MENTRKQARKRVIKVLTIVSGSTFLFLFLVLGWMANLFNKHTWTYTFGADRFPDAITIHNGFDPVVAIVSITGELKQPVKLYCNVNYNRQDSTSIGELINGVLLPKGKVNYTSGRRDYYGRELNVICVPVDSNASYGRRLNLKVEIY
ncbi:hypothetical protein BWI93_05640 [Siphonobacter sp. BAB-5385]|uniref:hypothetical protein n=1 Tax=Siphonobacter sp. BAB-5385 TaxID=1864822 RepID=UPI000B9E01CF|nr:hypothetical protein [Siphonobacter sp. BAB-5385]OZI09113.1 hypothetical protein BWI93_05640 [Siphonobacter sp. BAB-5385]